jgi:hypothetical protein
MGLLDDLKSSTSEAVSDGTPFAQSWRWENPGDGIEGVVVGTSSRVHDNHPDGYPIVTVRDAKGEDWAIHAMSTVLKNEITERNLRPGDELAVIYDGKKMSGGGRQFHAFRVASRPGNLAAVPAPAPQPASAQQAPQQSKAQAAVSDPWGDKAAAMDAPPF